MAFRVKDAAAAHARALELGAINVESDAAEGELRIPAIEGIGGSRELSIAKTKTEEAVMWAVKHITA